MNYYCIVMYSICFDLGQGYINTVFPQIRVTGWEMMNGQSSAPLGSNDVKYPPNVGRGLSTAELDVDKLYEPKQNKKIVRFA